MRKLILVVLLAAAGCGMDNPVEAEEDRIEGTWRHASCDYSGMRKAFTDYVQNLGHAEDVAESTAQRMLVQMRGYLPQVLYLYAERRWTDNAGNEGRWHVSGTPGDHFLNMASTKGLALSAAYTLEGDVLKIVVSGSQMLGLLNSDRTRTDMSQIFRPFSHETVLSCIYHRS